MTRLPYADRALADLRKLADYCLDPTHSRGRHKARVFRTTLGIGRDDAPWLQKEILDAPTNLEAIELARDVHGTRWRVDIPLARQASHAVIRTVWILKTGEDTPRLVTCWVL
jgi:hypothetical protein